MRKRTILFILLLIITVLSSCKQNSYNLYDLNNLPTIDFLQPWAFCNKTKDELNNHFNRLKNQGFDTVIVQNVTNYDNNEGINCYYDTTKLEFKKIYPNFLKDVIDVCHNLDIKVIVGLATEDKWWSYSEHNYNDDFLEMIFKQNEQVINEVVTDYQIDGLYYSNEMYSNNKSYALSWSKHLNKIIHKIESINKSIPLYISPFNSSAFIMSQNTKIKEWTNLFKNTNFRSIDYFLLQDGFGALKSNVTTHQASKIFNLNKEIRNSCMKYAKCNFILNIELFASDGYASKKRIKQQIDYGNMLGLKMACFSVSHYFINDDIFNFE